MLTFPDLNGAFVLKYYPLICVCVCMVMPWFTDIHPLTCIDSGIEGVTFTWKNNIRDMGRYWKGQVTISGTKSQQERIRPFHLTSVDFNNFLNANTWWQSSAHCWILHAEVFFFVQYRNGPRFLSHAQWQCLKAEGRVIFNLQSQSRLETLWRILVCLGIVWRWWRKTHQSLLLPSLSWLQAEASSWGLSFSSSALWNPRWRSLLPAQQRRVLMALWLV